MYNLFVSGDKDEWKSGEWEIEFSRFKEYTSEQVVARLGNFEAAAVQELKRLPCIFAYESACKKDPKFGRLLSTEKHYTMLHVRYEIQPVKPFLTHADLSNFKDELDVDKWELNRTHWAVKDINLVRQLASLNLLLPPWAADPNRRVDISTHRFDVALSFPGEARALVEKVAQALEQRIGPHAYFYDHNYQAQLARPSLDLLLQNIYGQRAKLLVLFIGGDYQRKDWCGVEYRAIREIISKREDNRVMLIRLDDGEVDGIFPNDGYVDSKRHTPEELAAFIHERAALLPKDA